MPEDPRVSRAVVAGLIGRVNPETAAHIRQALLDERVRLVAEGDVAVGVEPDQPVAAGLDEDEAPHREMDQSIASARNKERARRLAQVDDALRRLADDPDAYGLCEGCEEPIAPRRLALLPFVRLCVACQSGKETRASGRKRVTDYR